MLEQVVKFDQSLTLALNGSDSLFLDGFALGITATVTWLPAVVVLLYVIIRAGEMRDICLTVLALALCILLADQVASGIFKPLVARPRPAGDPSLMYLVDVVGGYRGGKYGFFSSHASNTFAVAVFLSLLVRHKPFTWVLLSWALLNCWSRVYLGVHYVGDILAGIVWGVVVGCSVYWGYAKMIPLRVRVNVANANVRTVSGFILDDVRWLMITLLLLYCYCCVRGFLFQG